MPDTDYALGLAISPDGQLLATGHRDKTVRFWDIAARLEMIRMTGHLDSVNVVAFSPDSKLLVSGSQDTTLLIWEVDSAVRAGRARLAKSAQPANFNKFWTQLSETDSTAAHKAVWVFIEAPERALPWLRQHLQVLGYSSDPNQAALVPKGETLRSLRAIQILELIDDPEARTLLVKLTSSDSTRIAEQASAALKRIERRREVAGPAAKEPNPTDLLEQCWHDLGEADAVLGQKAIFALAKEPANTVALCEARLKPAVKEEADAPLPIPVGAPLRAWRAIQVLELIGNAEARGVLQRLSQGAPARITREAKTALGRLEKQKRGP